MCGHTITCKNVPGLGHAFNTFTAPRSAVWAGRFHEAPTVRGHRGHVQRPVPVRSRVTAAAGPLWGFSSRYVSDMLRCWRPERTSGSITHKTCVPMELRLVFCLATARHTAAASCCDTKKLSGRRTRQNKHVSADRGSCVDVQSLEI